MTTIETIIEFAESFSNENLTIIGEGDKLTFGLLGRFHIVQLIVKDNQLTFTTINKDDIYDNHFVTLLNKSQLHDVDQLPDLIEFITNLDLHNYCAVCYNKLDVQSVVLVPCANNNCLYKYEELIIGNNVIEKFLDDPAKCKFLLESAIDAMTCERKYDIFEPYPKHFMKHDVDIERGTVSKLSGKDYDHIKDFNLLNKTIENLDIKTLTKTILSHKNKTDFELSKVIGKDLYILMRFILMSCKVDILKNDGVLDIEVSDFKLYKIVHYGDTEEKFKQISEGKQTNFLFHGSRSCNWFSILRNGLKNCSKTKLMTCGSAYGNGIYFSNDINVSFGYGSSGRKSVVGVFELINKEKYHKGGAIFVVDDENILIQRYLLIIPHKIDIHKLAKEINPLFNKQIHENKLNSAIKYNKKSVAKIMREYKSLSKLNPSNSSFRIEVDPDHLFQWAIYIGGFSDEYPIAQDMKKLGITEIQLEVLYPSDYPFSPPFVRVVTPRFARLTGHVIASSGAFCNELLTPKSWSPTCSIESVIVTLMSEIIEGGGRIDPVNHSVPYSLETAKADFNRVSLQHGWL